MNRGRERDGYLKKRGEGRKGGCLPRGRKAKTGAGLGFIKRKKSSCPCRLTFGKIL